MMEGDRPVRREAKPLNVAFYLPQFHPIPENDAAWGAGFTEWMNVAVARPRFRGHQQPVLPADLGFYDLRLAEARRAQIDLARRFLVDGFCWYHYWFNGRRLLHAPLDRMKADPIEDFPYLLCWANESWTRRWSGHSGEVIMRQTYSTEDDYRHIEFLVQHFHDSRYIRLNGRPVFAIYQPGELPDMRATADRWRTTVMDAGLPGIVLLGVQSFRSRIRDAARLGLDGIIDQQPDLRVVRPAWRAAPRHLAGRLHVASRFPKLVRYPYRKLVAHSLRTMRHHTNPWHFPTVCPGWDNSPRRDRGAVVLTGSTPEGYGRWLTETMRRTRAPIVFVNAWNEWAEGAHLEPDLFHGRAYLERHQRAVQAVANDVEDT